MNENEPTREELQLKVQALLERVAGLTSEYENKVADLRVALTFVTQERDEYKAMLEEKESNAKPDEK